MKILLVCLSMMLFWPSVVLAKDGNCTCYFIVKKEHLEQFSANTNRPIICESCEQRCRNLIVRIKEQQKAESVELAQFDCS